MKNQTTTRFEVGMNAMIIDNAEWLPVIIDSIHIEGVIIFAKSIDNREFCFNLQGFGYITDAACLIAFTLPEYEALKKLTDSFADGTFGSGKEQADLEQPETIDLLDEQGKPVYFTEGMEVGSLVYGKGKVADIDVDNGNIFINFPDEGEYWHTFDGRECTGGNQTLFPIDQYNTIQLPKLKPIQVPKPKADVISLPSWFKDSVHLENNHVCSFIQHQGIDTESAFDALISEFDIKASECDFSYCTVKRIGTLEKALCVDFVYQNKCYSLCIEIGFSESKPAIFEVHYQKSGKEIYEKLY